MVEKAKTIAITISLPLMLLISVSGATAQPQTPIAGHYPPGQSGIRGAVTPSAGVGYTNFSRFFSNLKVEDKNSNTVQDLNDLHYGNVSMITWTTEYKILGMSYGALGGVPFNTSFNRPSGGTVEGAGFGLGDILITPLSLYGKSTYFDYQVQFTIWTASGKFTPGASDNHGSGYWALVYSLGGVYYPNGERDAWSLSAVARIEQNFEQKDSGITPGDDIVIDWGIGKIIHAGKYPIDMGVSGFAVWQITSQTGGSSNADTSHYRFFGIGPEANLSATENLAFRVRAQWEFATSNAVQGNNLWLIVNYRF
ncbi:MAG: SphA family protein [bacterium]